MALIGLRSSGREVTSTMGPIRSMGAPCASPHDPSNRHQAASGASRRQPGRRQDRVFPPHSGPPASRHIPPRRSGRRKSTHARAKRPLLISRAHHPPALKTAVIREADHPRPAREIATSWSQKPVASRPDPNTPLPTAPVRSAASRFAHLSVLPRTDAPPRVLQKTTPLA